MEKNDSDNWHSIKNTEDLTMKQMFDIFEKLITGQSNEICGVKKKLGSLFMEIFVFDWKNLSSASSTQKRSTFFSDSVSYLGKIKENTQSSIAWEDRLTWFKSSPEYRSLDKIEWAKEIRVEHLHRFHQIADQSQSPKVTVKIERNTREF